MRLYLCPLTLLLQFTSYARPSTAQKLGDIEPLYIFTPGPAPGNCDQHKALIQSSYSEAIDMMNRSINVIDSLEVSPSQLETTGERSKWKTWAQLLKAIFNIPTDVTRGLDLNNSNVTLVKSYFEAMITYQNYKPPLSAPEKYWLFCDDSYYSWEMAPTNAVLDSWKWPNDGGKSRLRVEKYGYWNATGGTPANPYSELRPGFEGQNETSYKCHKPTQAFVTTVVSSGWTLQSITLCSKVFQKYPYSAAQLLAANKVIWGTTLKRLETPGTIMIHEWGHLINDLVDQTAVDKNGNPIYLDAQNPVRPRAVPTMSAVPATATSKEKRALVYGWDRVIWLARYEPDKVRRTPEAYMFFAMAVYYTQNNKYGLQFSSGYGLVPGANPFIP